MLRRPDLEPERLQLGAAGDEGGGGRATEGQQDSATAE